MKLNDIYLLVDLIFKGIVSILAVISTFWFISSFKGIKKYEDEILVKQKEYDEMEKTLAKKLAGMVSQPVLDKRTEKEREPLEQEINILKLKRQFILDKIPLVGYFKK